MTSNNWMKITQQPPIDIYEQNLDNFVINYMMMLLLFCIFYLPSKYKTHTQFYQFYSNLQFIQSISSAQLTDKLAIEITNNDTLFDLYCNPNTYTIPKVNDPLLNTLHSFNVISLEDIHNSHASLPNLQLLQSGFEVYRCDEHYCLGTQFSLLNKILKCITPRDSLSVQARDDGDIINFLFEASGNNRYSNFKLKSNEFHQDQLGILRQNMVELFKYHHQNFCYNQYKACNGYHSILY